MLVIVIVFCCFRATSSSNILVFMPSPWKSHIISFQPLFLELAYRGHNMTVVTKYYVENPPENYKQIIASYDIDNDGSNIIKCFLTKIISIDYKKLIKIKTFN